MFSNIVITILNYIIFGQIRSAEGVLWRHIRCSADPTERVQDGVEPDPNRFPWLGVVQHLFYVGGKTQGAISGAILVHPRFAFAGADDMAKIPQDQLANRTKLIFWGTPPKVYTVEVADYVLHPEYVSKQTLSSVALLVLVPPHLAKFSEFRAPVPPVCMPVHGAGTFTDLYAVKYNDDSGTLKKEVISMKYLDEKACDEFYDKSKLSVGNVGPLSPLCVTARHLRGPCVWDSGTALITRQTWGYWKLLGFAVLGPGCGVPTKFLNVHSYLPWINDVINSVETGAREDSDVIRVGVRRVNPIELYMYKAEVNIPNEIGNCDKENRGTVLYKEAQEILSNRNFAQGYYFMEVMSMAQYNCFKVRMEVQSRTNAAVWLEHMCHPSMMGTQYGVASGRAQHEKYQARRECFMYFKTSAFIEIRYFFSFKARVELSLYGDDEQIRFVPDPFKTSQATENWWPHSLYHMRYFVPYEFKTYAKLILHTYVKDWYEL